MPTVPAAPERRLIRVGKVMEMTSFSRSTIWRLSTEGRFPKSTRIGHRCAVWDEAEVAAWIDQQFAGAAA